MANENGRLNNADIISAITNLNLPTNGNNQNTAVTPSPHDVSRARILQNKALAIQNRQQAEILKRANEAFSKQPVSTVPPINLPSFVEYGDTSTEDFTDVELPKAATKEEMTTPFTELGLPPPVKDTPKPLDSKDTFDFDKYKRLVRGAESGGYVDPNIAQNPNSSALGTYQFTEDTWNDLVTNYPGRGLTVNGRTDGAQQEIAADLLTNENKVNLENKNIPVTNGNMYVMHALGAGDGSMMLQAAINGDTRLAADLVHPEVVESNPTWFRGNPTPQGLVDHLSGLVDARVTD